MSRSVADFVSESNYIEGIEAIRPGEVEAHQLFLGLLAPGVDELCAFVAAVQPGARLRDERGLGVRVGNHHPPWGGPEIRRQLEALMLRLDRADPGPYRFHVRYETLHPFTDGNGRSGRVLWLWQMWRRVPRVPPLGFLHTWYYQSLEGAR